jgi:hypothetical protein
MCRTDASSFGTGSGKQSADAALCARGPLPATHGASRALVGQVVGDVEHIRLWRRWRALRRRVPIRGKKRGRRGFERPRATLPLKHVLLAPLLLPPSQHT